MQEGQMFRLDLHHCKETYSSNDRHNFVSTLIHKIIFKIPTRKSVQCAHVERTTIKIIIPITPQLTARKTVQLTNIVKGSSTGQGWELQREIRRLCAINALIFKSIMTLPYGIIVATLQLSMLKVYHQFIAWNQIIIDLHFNTIFQSNQTKIHKGEFTFRLF